MDIKTDPTASLQSTEATEKPVLLIVDDSRLMRHTLKKMLSNDFNLVEAVDGEDGWEKLLAEPRIEAVFSDLSMPNLDGYGLLERIRKAAEARINTLPFIVITGKEGDDQSLLEEVRKHGANGFVSKPFKTDDIISKTRAFLTRPTETSTETPVEISDETVRLAAEEEARRIAEQAEAQRLAAEAEAQRLAEEAARQAAEEEARRIAEQAEAQRLAAEAEAQRLAEEAARQAAEEEAQRIAEQAEAQRLAAEDEAQRLAEETARQAAEEEAQRIAEQAEAEARRQAAVTEARRQVEEAAQKAAIEPAPFTLLERFGVRVALPFIHISHVVLDIPSDEQYATLRKRLKRK